MRITAAHLIALSLALVLTSGARAQDQQPEPAEDVPAVVEEPDPEPVRGIRYRVWMKSGRTMEGVVRAKGVFEARDLSGGYRPAEEDERTAGVRFWFPAAQDGFIFMELREMSRLEELGELSTSEGRSIARARRDAKKRAERERFQIKARRAAEEAAARAAEEGEDEASAGTDESADEGEKEPAADEKPEDGVDAGRMAALLLKYPPTRWSLDSPQEIERRKVVLGLFPSDEEKAFLAVFDEWKAAYEAWVEAEEAANAESGEPAADDGTAQSR